MKRIFCLFALVFFFAAARAEINPEKVYVVANSDDPDSVAIAEFYCSARSVPRKNIVLLPMPKKGEVSKADYFAKIENPLTARLVELGAVKAFKLGSKDSYGREIYSYVSHDISFVVFCRGVPWGVQATPKSPKPKPPKSFQDGASVDSEFSARFLPSKSLAGFVANPLFGKSNWGSLPSITGVIPTARLDGITRADAENLVKNAIVAESKGVAGRAYIDKSKYTKEGDEWLEQTKRLLDAEGFDISESPSRALFGYGERMDAPAFYFGWYSKEPKGYFAERGFRFPRGAGALHIYSFSARNMRSEKSWTPSFVAQGVCSTFGNVYEPYLGGTHRPQVYMAGLLASMSAGEAAFAANPLLSWQTVFVGDPMFKPFKVGLDAQIAAIDSGETDGYSQYSVIRKMNLIARASGDEAAADFGKKYVGKMSDAALLLKLSQLAKKLKNNAQAAEFARTAISRDIYSKISDCSLVFELCRILTPISADDRKLARSALERIVPLSQSKGFRYALCDFAKPIDRREKLDGVLSDIIAEVERERAAEKAAREAKAAAEKAKSAKKPELDARKK